MTTRRLGRRLILPHFHKQIARAALATSILITISFLFSFLFSALKLDHVEAFSLPFQFSWLRLSNDRRLLIPFRRLFINFFYWYFFIKNYSGVWNSATHNLKRSAEIITIVTSPYCLSLEELIDATVSNNQLQLLSAAKSQYISTNAFTTGTTGLIVTSIFAISNGAPFFSLSFISLPTNTILPLLVVQLKV